MVGSLLDLPGTVVNIVIFSQQIKWTYFPKKLIELVCAYCTLGPCIILYFCNTALADAVDYLVPSLHIEQVVLLYMGPSWQQKFMQQNASEAYQNAPYVNQSLQGAVNGSAVGGRGHAAIFVFASVVHAIAQGPGNIRPHGMYYKTTGLWVMQNMRSICCRKSGCRMMCCHCQSWMGRELKWTTLKMWSIRSWQLMT